MNVVEVDDAVARDMIIGGRQLQLGYEASAGTGQCHHDDGADAACYWVSGENEDRPVTAWRGGEP
jgi:hypothetical protein